MDVGRGLSPSSMSCSHRSADVEYGRPASSVAYTLIKKSKILVIFSLRYSKVIGAIWKFLSDIICPQLPWPAHIGQSTSGQPPLLFSSVLLHLLFLVSPLSDEKHQRARIDLHRSVPGSQSTLA
ncbi:hypothetical protein H5410_026145 [Solanum commersonii]|uniref:Uncharacterized protein n=1 Tax=Solanum commersonii TaxID=4109 RepID=A0A9J5YXU9_SOLCO|nr:hypothetical protein H5410_026145 [Solanum commersonii]